MFIGTVLAFLRCNVVHAASTCLACRVRQKGVRGLAVAAQGVEAGLQHVVRRARWCCEPQRLPWEGIVVPVYPSFQDYGYPGMKTWLVVR